MFDLKLKCFCQRIQLKDKKDRGVQISGSADLLDRSWHWEPVAGDVLVGHEVEHHVVLLVGDWNQVNKAPKRRSCQSKF